MIHGRRGEQGFTLVEMLVSLAILALMTAYTIQALSVMQDMSRLAERMADDQEIDTALRHIRDTIADTRPYMVPDGKGGQQLRFAGEQDALTLVTVSGGERERGGFYAVTLERDDEGRLIERRQLIGSRADHQTLSVLIARTKSVALAYLDEGDSVASPKSSWQNPNRLPAAIVLRVVLDGKEEGRTNDISTLMILRH